MKALPLLFVGLAALSAGCSSWNNRQTPGLAGPLPFPGDPQPSSVAAPGTSGPAAAGESEHTGGASPAVTLEVDAGAAGAVIGQTAAHSDVWRTEYESQQRRPIKTLRVGEGDRRIFVTGSLYGDDVESARLLDALAAQLSAAPVEAGVRYLLVRSPNPDGLAAGEKWNANGVDLNRNFPTLRLFRHGEDRSGSFPASEPETRVMLRLLGDFQPDCVIQVRTADVPALRVFVNTAGESALEDTLDELQVERGRFNEVAGDGSLEEFASQRLQAETITVVVPQSSSRRKSTVDTLLTLCTAGSAPLEREQTPDGGLQPPLAGADPHPDPVARGPAELTGNLEPIEQDGVQGFVELLPPPPVTESGVDRPGFYELPPAQ